ncbi:MAG: hypothetical protein ACTTKL_02765 [Treponema sp.]
MPIKNVCAAEDNIIRAQTAAGIGRAAEPFRRNGAGRRNPAKPGFCGFRKKPPMNIR